MKILSKVLLVALFACATMFAQAKSMTVLIANSTANDTQAAANDKFGELITKYSHGRLRGAVRNGGALGSESQSIAAVQLGSVQGMVLAAGYLSPIVPAISLFDLPFMIPSEPADITAFCAQSKAAALMKKLAEKKGIHILGFDGIGGQDLLTRFPVHGIADLKGKKMRVIPSPPRVGAFKDWGAIPRPMQMGEVYTSLQQGVIDGMDDPPDVIYKMKLYEVAKYFTITNHISFVSAVIVSKVWFDDLPKDLQKAVIRAGRDTIAFADRSYTHAQHSSMAAMRKVTTVTKMPAAQIRKMKELAANGVWKRMAADPKKGPIVRLLKQDVANFKKHGNKI